MTRNVKVLICIYRVFYFSIVFKKRSMSFGAGFVQMVRYATVAAGGVKGDCDGGGSRGFLEGRRGVK